MSDIEEVHFRETLREDGPVRDLVIEANRILGRLRDIYGNDLPRRYALELHDEILSVKLSDLLEDISIEDSVVANYWIGIPDHDRTGDYIPRSLPGDLLGLDGIGFVLEPKR